MRCLGIPNTKHFHDITGIADARNRMCYKCSLHSRVAPDRPLTNFRFICASVYDKIKGQISTEVWKPDELEEFEDSEGNVLNKKVCLHLSNTSKLHLLPYSRTCVLLNRLLMICVDKDCCDFHPADA